MASDRAGGRDAAPTQGEAAPLFAVAMEFAGPDALLAGVRSLQPRGLGRLETHSPIPIRGLSDAMGVSGTLVPFAVLGVLAGAGGMFAFCLYVTTIAYPLDVGGRPVVSWPAFVVPSVSFGMLAGAVAVYLSMLVTNRLPRLNHPSFNIPNVTRATQDRFFLTLSPEDAPLDVAAIDAALRDLPEAPLAVTEVPR